MHTSWNDPNDLSTGQSSQQELVHASRHDPNDLSPGRASQQEPISSDTSNLILLNVVSETVPEGDALQ